MEEEKAEKEAEGGELGKEIEIAPVAPKPARKKISKPRKPRDGLCVMCKTYLFDETLGDCYCCGDACAEEYALKQKKKAAEAAAALEEGSITEAGVKRKRSDGPDAEGESKPAATVPRRTSGRSRGNVNYAEDS